MPVAMVGATPRPITEPTTMNAPRQTPRISLRSIISLVMHVFTLMPPPPAPKVERTIILDDVLFDFATLRAALREVLVKESVPWGIYGQSSTFIA